MNSADNAGQIRNVYGTTLIMAAVHIPDQIIDSALGKELLNRQSSHGSPICGVCHIPADEDDTALTFFYVIEIRIHRIEAWARWNSYFFNHFYLLLKVVVDSQCIDL